MQKLFLLAVGIGVVAVTYGVTQDNSVQFQQASSLRLQPTTTLALPQLQANARTGAEELDLNNRVAAGTTPKDLKAILESEADNLKEQQQGQFEFTYEGRKMFVLTHQPMNRMRIVTPVIAEQDLTEVQRQNLLVANFHTALDARYAVSDGVVFSIYLHPLSTLDTADFQSALGQVAALAKNFGTTYSSDVLQFGGQAQPQDGPLEGLPGA